MSEREAAQKCPECYGRKIDSLASDEAILRLQCANPKCLHQWNTPRDRFRAAIEADRERRAHEIQQREANVKFCCSKCSETFTTARSRGQHQRYCTFEKDEKVTKRRDPAPPASTASAITDNLLAILSDKRTERLAQLMTEDPTLREIDAVIERIKSRV